MDQHRLAIAAHQSSVSTLQSTVIFQESIILGKLLNFLLIFFY